MIKSIKVGQIGPLTENVELNLEYKNLKTDFKKIIDIDKQVWNSNRLRLVTGIMGKNATGKTSFFQFVSMGQIFCEPIIVRHLVGFLNFHLKKELNEKVKEQRVTRQLGDREIEFLNFIANNIELDELNDAIDKTIKHSINKIIGNTIIEQSNSRENALFEYEKVDINNNKNELYSFKILKDNGEFDIHFNQSKDSLRQTLLKSFKQEIKKVDNEFLISFDHEKMFNSISNFFGCFKRDFVIISSRGSDSNFMSQRQNIINVIQRLSNETSMDFVNLLLKSVDKNIQGLKYDDEGKLKIVFQDIRVGIDWLSSGTQKLLTTIDIILETFKEGKMIFFDEIDNGLQMKIVKILLNLFTIKEINKNGSQIIFTTHNIAIVDAKMNYLNLKNLFFFFRKQAIEIINYWDWSKDNNIRIENRSNIAKYFFNDETNEYEFMLTKEEETLLTDEIKKYSNNK